MDPGVELTEINRYENAKFLSKLFFVWILPLYRKCMKDGLFIRDLYKTMTHDKSDSLGNALETNWKKELANGRQSLKMAIIKTFFWQYMQFGFVMFVQFVILRTSQPIILAYFIYLFSDKMKTDTMLLTKMYLCGSVLVLVSVVTMFVFHQCTFGQFRIGMRVRVAVSSLIYRKMLRLSKQSLGQTTAGQLINLLSNDVARFDLISFSLHIVWIAPFQVAIVAYFIWLQVGISSLAGIISIIVFTIPCQVSLAKLTLVYREKVAQRTDQRVKVMSEIISGIQVIKMYAWEKPFEKMIGSLRRFEIKALTISAYIKGLFISAVVFTERTTLYFTLLCYTLLGYMLTAEKVFSTSQFCSLLQLVMAKYLPATLSLGAETLVTIRRLQEFLVLEEVGETTKFISQGDNIYISNVEATWHPDSKQNTLKNVTLEIQRGQLCGIVGGVGSGKSSLLQLILGELIPQTGEVSICGSVSYASQDPWLFSSSVRNNILFGSEYNKLKYKKVSEACALFSDFQHFSNGDSTIVGERGVLLSGGQRARINLARAVYRDADIYLLDDPLSAVDTHVGKHLFDKCIMQLLGGKTRILVTHQVQFLKKADVIVVLNEGSVDAVGTFADLIKSNVHFSEMMTIVDAPKERPNVTTRMSRTISIASTRTAVSSIYGSDTSIISEISEQVGLTGKSAYKEYINAIGNGCIIATVGVVFVMGQIAISGADYWTSYWTRQDEERQPKLLHQSKLSVPGKIKNLKIFESKNHHVGENIPESFDRNLAIYSGIIVGLILLTTLRSFAFFKITMTASKNIHSLMFHNLLKAPMSFFDTNASGRILNRFSKDMGTVDELLPKFMMETLQTMLVLTGIWIIVGITNFYNFLTGLLLFGLIFFILRKWYLVSAKSLKHLEAICKSPMFSHVNASLHGITTIRACKIEKQLIEQFDHHQDTHTSAHFLTIACMSSFGLWLDIIAVIYTACVIFTFIFLEQYSQISGSVVGLAISQCLILTGMLQYGIRQSAEVINQMTSVERILQYTTLTQEGPFVTEKFVSKSWPDNGSIRFSKVWLQYSDDRPVLKDIDLYINPGEKIGIVGRTGAGKSSFVSALFRLAPVEGLIEIDDVDIQGIGLTNLRQKISIIPQEPVLFSATLRYNLDPFEEFDEVTLWGVLEEVELKDLAPSLDFVIEEGGNNLSLGQRQLICLARAIVRDNKILVLDEATANVDSRTDRFIQATIRRKFAQCTVLTVAHRLNTVMDSDRVLVMDHGNIVEFDHPHILLQNENGIFTGMVNQTGTRMAKEMREIAREAYINTIPFSDVRPSEDGEQTED